MQIECIIVHSIEAQRSVGQTDTWTHRYIKEFIHTIHINKFRNTSAKNRKWFDLLYVDKLSKYIPKSEPPKTGQFVQLPIVRGDFA